MRRIAAPGAAGPYTFPGRPAVGNYAEVASPIVLTIRVDIPTALSEALQAAKDKAGT